MLFGPMSQRFTAACECRSTACIVICVMFLAIVTAYADKPSSQSNGGPLSVHIEQDDTTLSVKVDGRPAVEYLFGGVEFKPCLNRWYTPAGVNILRDSPHDHLHHHAMMFAVAVDGVNFWEEHPKEDAGKEVGQKPRDIAVLVDNGAGVARFTQMLDWMGPGDKLLLKERRTIEFIVENGLDASLLNWSSTLSVPPGKESTELGGSHYFGLGMRFVESMDKIGKMVIADGKASRSVVDILEVVPARWVAYSAPVDGKTVTVAIFDHPKNPRFPGGIFHMTKPFAYLSATIGLSDKPYEIRSAKPLVLKYGAALWDGEVGVERIEAVYKSWVNENLQSEGSEQ